MQHELDHHTKRTITRAIRADRENTRVVTHVTAMVHTRFTRFGKQIRIDLRLSLPKSRWGLVGRIHYTAESEITEVTQISKNYTKEAFRNMLRNYSTLLGERA